MKAFTQYFTGLPNQNVTCYGVHASARIGRLWVTLCGFGYLFVFAATGYGQQSGHEGDVTDVRVIRRVEQHPYA